MLKVDPQKRMLFNPAESIDFQGDTGPFVQYTFARINSIMRSAQAEDKLLSNPPTEIKSSEVQLIQSLLAYKNELQKAAQLYSPSIIANYLLQVAKAFNRLYNDVSILKAIDVNERAFRLHLSALTAETIQHGLGLLGVNSPARM
jgi:arginyl-tRNA synthetase